MSRTTSPPFSLDRLPSADRRKHKQFHQALAKARVAGEEAVGFILLARGGRVCNVLPELFEEDDPSASDEDAAADTSAPDTKETTGTVDEILKVLRNADRPLKAQAIAAQAKLPFTDHFRKTVYALAEKDTITSCPEHRYWLADRPLPE